MESFPFPLVFRAVGAVAYVAGVERGRGRGNLGARDSVWGAPHAVARAQIPPSPSPFNAGHVGYRTDGAKNKREGEGLQLYSRGNLLFQRKSSYTSPPEKRKHNSAKSKALDHIYSFLKKKYKTVYRDRGGGGAGRAAAPPLFCAPALTFCAKKKNNQNKKKT